MAAGGLICVGVIARPHGIRGECVADLDLDDPELLLDAGAVRLFTPAQWREAEMGSAPAPVTRRLRGLRQHKGRVLLQFEGVDDRNDAEDLRGWLLCITEQALPELDEGEVYCRELVGLEVLLEDGRQLGVLADVQFPSPDQELWIIATSQGKEVLFPAHSETVLDIDTAAQQVRIAPPPGLIELYLGG